MSAQKKHRKIFIIGGIVAVIMFGFCFAMVPLYSLICKKTGISTTVGTDLITPAASAEISKSVDMSREVTIQFTATNHMGMTWDFYPHTRSIKVHPGEKIKVLFYAKNTMNHQMTVQAIPSMTPTDAISHFHKIECFCFHQQSLKGSESKDMPLVFQVDHDLPKDIHVITLAYTLFDVTPKEIKKG
jgi:cytochrome c oxidase assembly protein subunit 11